MKIEERKKTVNPAGFPKVLRLHMVPGIFKTPGAPTSDLFTYSNSYIIIPRVYRTYPIQDVTKSVVMRQGVHKQLCQ